MKTIYRPSTGSLNCSKNAVLGTYTNEKEIINITNEDHEEHRWNDEVYKKVDYNHNKNKSAYEKRSY